MLLTIGIILFALWALGLYSGAELGNWVHILLMFSLVSFLLAVVNSSRKRSGSKRA